MVSEVTCSVSRALMLEYFLLLEGYSYRAA